jgi:DNA-binding transcriptional ArsR family regulator
MADKKDKRLSLAVSEEEAAILRAVADRRGITVSELLRKVTISEVMGEYMRLREGVA